MSITPPGSDGQFAAWRKRIEQRLDALSTARRKVPQVAYGRAGPSPSIGAAAGWSTMAFGLIPPAGYDAVRLEAEWQVADDSGVAVAARASYAGDTTDELVVAGVDDGDTVRLELSWLAPSGVFGTPITPDDPATIGSQAVSLEAELRDTVGATLTIAEPFVVVTYFDAGMFPGVGSVDGDGTFVVI